MEDSGSGVGPSPALLPVLPHVDLAGLHRPGSPAGGAWFDAVVTERGAVAAVCGEVPGHGAAATAARSELATALRGALLGGTPPAAALDGLGRLAAGAVHTRGTTAVVLLLDPATGVLRHARAGHPPVLVRRTAGIPDLLDRPGGAPLGTGGAPVPEDELRLGPGDTVLAHTDRTVGRRPGEGATRLRIAAAHAAPGAAGLCAAAAATSATGAGRGRADDVAALAIGLRADPVAGLDLDVPADATELAGLRDRCTDWLVALDVTAAGVTAVPLIVSELVGNSVEHGYAYRPGRVHVTADLDGRGGVRLVVADRGRWRPPDPGGRRGYGLTVVRELCSAFDLHTGDGGTTVTAVCDLHVRTAVGTGRPGPVATGVQTAARPGTGVP